MGIFIYKLVLRYKKVIDDDKESYIAYQLLECAQMCNDLDDKMLLYVENQIKLRAEAKKNKDFQTADKIRNELLEKGIELKDTREGTVWNKI